MKEAKANALRSEMRQLGAVMQDVVDGWFSNLDDGPEVREAKAQAQRDLFGLLFPDVYGRVVGEDRVWGKGGADVGGE